MKFARFAALLLLGTFCEISALHAGVIRPSPSTGSQKELSATHPPTGYVELCSRAPGQCRHWSGQPEIIALTVANWKLLLQVNLEINKAITAVSDQKHYGQVEFWAYPINAGDCEDFVLLKQQTLIGRGLPENALLITVVRDEKGEGHAVLTAATSDGDYILDNRRNDIRPWNKVGYTFMKRQSVQDPNRWVSLNANQTNTNQLTSARAGKVK